MAEPKPNGPFQRMKRVWHDPVWSKVIAAGIVGISASLWATIHFDWWKSVSLLLSATWVPNWLICVGLLFLAVAAMYIGELRNTAAAKKTTEESRAPDVVQPASAAADPWSIETIDLMHKLSDVYSAQHLSSKFDYLHCKYEVRACCLSDRGETAFGQPDYSRSEVTFRPSHDPIYCWSVALSQSQAKEARYFGGLQCEVHDRHGHQIDTIQVPVRNPNFSEDRELLLFFNPVLRSDGNEPYTIVLQQYIYGLMEPLRKEGKDELSFTPRRAIGDVGQIDLVLHFPLRYAVRAQPKVGSGMGRQMSDSELGKFESEPGFSPIGWTGKEVPAGTTFAFDILL